MNFVCFGSVQQIVYRQNKKKQLLLPSGGRYSKPPTSFGFGETFVQVEHDFLHEVLDVAVIRAADEHHPVVGEAFRRGLLSDLRSVSQLQSHLNGALRDEQRLLLLIVLTR